MSTTRLITPYTLTNLQINRSSKSETFIFNPRFRLSVLKQNDRSCFAANGGLRYLWSDQGSRRGRNKNLELVVYSNVQPGAPPSSDPSPNSLKNWILGALIAIILPFFRNKWGPLFKLAQRIETAAEKVEHVNEVIQKVAEEAEKVADEVADELPEGGKLRNAIESVENVAGKIDKAAHLVDGIIDKVEEVDKEVESFMEPDKDQPNETTKEATDQK